MSKKFLSPINLRSLSSDPVSGSDGDIYYNSTSKLVRIYKDGAWANLTSSGGGGGLSAVVDDTSPVLGGNLDANQLAITNINYLLLDTTPASTPTNPGSIYWDSSNETVQVQLNSDVLLQLGQEHLIRVKNNSGTVAIPDMTVVMFSGSTGDTVKVSPAVSDGTYPAEYIVGITTQEIPADGFGFVTQFGFINHVDTDTPAWNEGAILYADPANPGKLTVTEPAAPAWKMRIAAVTRRHAVTGRILVRIIPVDGINSINDIQITGTPNNNELLAYDTSSSTWINQTADEANLVDKSSTQTITGAKTFSGSIIANGNITSSTLGLIVSNDDAVSINTLYNNMGIAEDTGFSVTTGSSGTLKVLTFNNSGNLIFPDTSSQSTAFLGISSYDTDDVSEGTTNKYFTNERAVSALTSTLSDYLTTSSAASTYLTQSNAASTYLSQSNASSTYLTQSSAGSTYQPLDSDLTAIAALTGDGFLKKISGTWEMDSNSYLTTSAAADTYLTQSNASSTYAPINSPTLTTPNIGDSSGSSINLSKVASTYNTVVNSLYANSSTDYKSKIMQSPFSIDIEFYDSSDILKSGLAFSNNGFGIYDWDYNWRYQLDDSNVRFRDQSLNTIFQMNMTSGYTSVDFYHDINFHTNNLSNLIVTSGTWNGNKIDYQYGGTGLSSLGTSGQVLKVNSTEDAIEWGTIDALPSQTGNSGKYLTTDGLVASWATIDLSSYLTTSSAESTYLTQSNAASTYQPIGSYLTSYTETDTLSSVTGRGATTSHAISITDTTSSTSSTTGALKVSGGVGIGGELYVGGNLDILGNFTVHGTTTTVETSNLEVTDPLIYIATGNSANISDIGFVGHFDNGTYQHTGLVRDASDGIWKLFSAVTTEPSSTIDFTGATYDTLKIGTLEASSVPTVGTINSGVWHGTAIGYAYGGTGLNTLGTAGQVLKVNAGGTAIVWGDVTSGSSFTNSSELAALLSDETGTGYAVFNNSPTLITPVLGDATATSINGTSIPSSKTLVVTTDSINIGTTSIALNRASGSQSLTGITSIDGSAATLTTPRSIYGNNFDGSAALTGIIASTYGGTGNGFTKFTGPTISEKTYTLPDSNATLLYENGNAKLNSLNIDDKAIVDTFTGTGNGAAQNIDTAIDETIYTGAEYLVSVKTSTGRYLSKVLLICDGTNAVTITEYGILTIGTAPSVTIAAGGSASAPQLSVNAPSSSNITLVRTLVAF